MRPVLALAIVALLAADAAALEWWDNWMSTVYDPASSVYDFNCRRVEPGSVITVTLWLVRPVNPDAQGAERPVTRVAGFDCRVTMSEGLVPLGWTAGGPGIFSDNGGALYAEFDPPLEVIDGRAALAACDVLVVQPGFDIPEQPVFRCINYDNAWTFMDGLPFGRVPDTVSYVDADDPVDGRVVPNTFDEFDHAFQIVQSLVDAAQPTWSTVKAQYR
jgi:hypothetical protein